MLHEHLASADSDHAVHPDISGALNIAQNLGSIVQGGVGRWVHYSPADHELKRRWLELAHHASEANAFAEYWAVASALEAFACADEIPLFTFWSSGAADADLLGVMPVVLRNHYGQRRIPHLIGWMHPNLFLGGPLVAAGHEQAFWAALLNAVDAKQAGALFFQIESMTLGGPLEKALFAAARAQKRPIGLVHQEKRAFINHIDDAEVYFSEAVRGKKRKELRRQKKRLEEHGALRFETLEGRDMMPALDKWLDDFLMLERAGWKGENGSALACHAETEKLFRGMLSRAAELRRLQLRALYLDEKPIAMLVNFVCAPGAFSFKTAYDEDYARFSPGVLLQEVNLELLTRTDIKWADSCAAEGHPMIDSIWRGRKSIGHVSVGIGSAPRRMIFSALLRIEQYRTQRRARLHTQTGASKDDD